MVEPRILVKGKSKQKIKTSIAPIQGPDPHALDILGMPSLGENVCLMKCLHMHMIDRAVVGSRDFSMTTLGASPTTKYVTDTL